MADTLVVRADATALPLADQSVDAIVTDPPYNLGFMGKEWDSPGLSFVERSADRRNTFDHVGGNGNHNPAGSADQVRTRQVEAQRYGTWCQEWASECLRVLKPGGHMLAFGGTRTWHRLACAIEDAGFEIRDCVADLTGIDGPGLLWLYGQGFPKNLDVSKAIDKAARGVPQGAADPTSPNHGRYKTQATEGSRGDGDHGQGYGAGPGQFMLRPGDTDPATGRRVVSAGEPVRRMIPGADQNRTGSWIKDNGREFVPLVTEPATTEAARWEGWGTALKPAWEPVIVARKPLTGTVAASVLEHGTGALNIAGCRVEHASEADRAESESKNRHGDYGTAQGGNTVYGDYGMVDGGERSNYDGSAGRWPPNVLLGAEAAAESDRQSGATASRIGRPRASARPGAGYGMTHTGAEYADAGGASRFFPVFRHTAKAGSAERPRGDDGTLHPTVKPVDLMRWLVRLVTPPGGLVLDCFAGSGTTAEACITEGFRCILIEKDPAYCELIRKRLAKPMQPVLFGGAA